MPVVTIRRRRFGDLRRIERQLRRGGFAHGCRSSIEVLLTVPQLDAAMHGRFRPSKRPARSDGHGRLIQLRHARCEVLMAMAATGQRDADRVLNVLLAAITAAGVEIRVRGAANCHQITGVELVQFRYAAAEAIHAAHRRGTGCRPRRLM